MRSFTTRYVAWITLLAAFALWMGIGYFAWAIYAQQFLREEKIVNLEQEARRSAAAMRLHALVRDTKEERTELQNIARVDLDEMLEAIEQVGRDAGIPIEIGQAISTPTAESGSNVHSIGFVVEGEGSFAKVVRAAALFESLPKPSFVDELQFEMLPGGAGGSKRSAGNTWHLVVRIQFISTADISS